MLTNRFKPWINTLLWRPRRCKRQRNSPRKAQKLEWCIDLNGDLMYMRYERRQANRTRPRFDRLTLIRCRPHQRYVPFKSHGSGSIQCRKAPKPSYWDAGETYFLPALQHPRGRPPASLPGHSLERMGYSSFPF